MNKKSVSKIIGLVVFAVSCVFLYGVQGPKKATEIVKSNLESKDLLAQVNYIFDGDTFAAKVALKNDTRISVSVRIMQIDTPEIKGECESEIILANRAKKRLAELAPVGSYVKLSSVKDDKYLGRIDAYVINESGQDVGEILIQEKLARRYNGGHRNGWCN